MFKSADNANGVLINADKGTDNDNATNKGTDNANKGSDNDNATNKGTDSPVRTISNQFHADVQKSLRDSHLTITPIRAPPRHAESRRRCGTGEPSPGADVARVNPLSARMWQRRAQSQSTP